MSAGLLHSIDQSTQLAGHNRMALLLFRVDARQLFGINVFKVQEVIPRPALTWMPDAHPVVRGVADIRGRMVTVIDLAAAIGATAVTANEAAHVIVAEFNRSVQGFLVKAVERIAHVNVADVKPPLRNVDGQGYLTAMTRIDDELIEVVDVEKILSDVIGEPPLVSDSMMGAARALARGRRVLVADDSRIARNQIEKILGQIGIDCVLVNDGHEALQYLQGLADQGANIGERIALVISDVEMPGLDGYTLTTRIRQDERLKALRVILHTSLSGLFNNAMVERVGPNRFIAKFCPDDLARAVLEQLQRSH